jgi:hypothetical protein
MSTTTVTWHIAWQVVEGHDLLALPALVEQIRARLLEAHRLPGRELLYYLLTPTELHLLSRLPAGRSPGEVARAIGNIVARWVRQAQGVPGVVFAGRYRADAMASDEDARLEIRMLAWRPVVLGLCRAPTHYPTSTLRATVGMSRPLGFETLVPLRLFGHPVSVARAALRNLIAKRPGPTELRQLELTRGLALAPGLVGTFSLMTRPVQGLAAALVAASRPQGIDGALQLLERWVLVKLHLRGVDSLATLPAPTGARIRALVAVLAVKLDLCPAASVARHYHRAKATLSERMAACRHQAEDQAILNVPLGRIVEEAIELAGTTA